MTATTEPHLLSSVLRDQVLPIANTSRGFYRGSLVVSLMPRAFISEYGLDPGEYVQRLVDSAASAVRNSPNRPSNKRFSSMTARLTTSCGLHSTTTRRTRSSITMTAPTRTYSSASCSSRSPERRCRSSNSSYRSGLGCTENSRSRNSSNFQTSISHRSVIEFRV